MQSSKKQIIFMPWVKLHQELKVGPVTFWPFSSLAESKIPEKSIRDHLLKIFNCYKDHQNNPVKSITICSHNSSDSNGPDRGQVVEIRQAVDALILSVICSATVNAVKANNYTMGPPSSDYYALIGQKFEPDCDDISIRSGSATHVWRIGDIIFQKPWHLGGPSISLDECLLSGFAKTFQPDFSSDERERVFRSLEWFHLAHTEFEGVSNLSKVVMMSTAFEILLQFPEHEKSRYFADELNKNCASDAMLRETREIGKKKEKIIYPLISWWGWDFYRLRNSIVHGDKVEENSLRFSVPNRDWLTHLIVADIVFWQCVKRRLYDLNCLGQNIKDTSKKWDSQFPESVEASSESQLRDWFLGFKAIHQALNWLPQATNSHSEHEKL